MLLTIALVALAAAFVVVCGANDGGTLLALAIRHSVLPGWGLLVVLATAIAAGPAVFGLAVARTFADQLVHSGDPRTGALVTLGGVTAALAVVLGLTWAGVPTSVTLAVIGGLSGAGLGFGVPPAWGTVALVLLIGVAAPLVGVALGFGLARLANLTPRFQRLPAAVRLGQVASFAGQSLAYAANDGQKMFAVAGTAAAAAYGTGGMRAPSLPVLALLVGLFAVGAVLSLRRAGRGPAASMLAYRPWQLVSAQVASSVAVFGSAAGGVPVSMTQSAMAGLVGAGASPGARRVRWQFATPVVTSWVSTLPVSGLAGALAGGLLRVAA